MISDLMWRSPRSRGLFMAALCICGIVLSVQSAHGADDNGAYAVKGAGTANCKRFVSVFDSKSAELANFGGWIDGFVTAHNGREAETFDFVPWQSTEVLAYSLAQYCRKVPDLSFHQAMLAMLKSLKADRMASSSPVLVARRNDKAVLIYDTVLEQIRRKLVAQGFLGQMPTGAFDDSTAEALLRFQKQAGIAQTGLPDQATLAKLLGAATVR